MGDSPSKCLIIKQYWDSHPLHLTLVAWASQLDTRGRVPSPWDTFCFSGSSGTTASTPQVETRPKSVPLRGCNQSGPKQSAKEPNNATNCTYCSWRNLTYLKISKPFRVVWKLHCAMLSLWRSELDSSGTSETWMGRERSPWGCRWGDWLSKSPRRRRTGPPGSVWPCSQRHPNALKAFVKLYSSTHG